MLITCMYLCVILMQRYAEMSQLLAKFILIQFVFLRIHQRPNLRFQDNIDIR